jgi:phage terminase large subunit
MSKINEIYKPLYTTDKRYILITGGRGSLKSTTVHDFICRLTYEQGHGVLFTRYTMTSAEKSIIPEFITAIQRLGIESDFYITKNKIVNIRTDSFIIFSGIKTSSGDQTANLKSIAGITTWVIDEGEDFTDEKTFDRIDDSIRTVGKQNRVIWIQNPTTKEHFIYKRFIESKSKQIKVEGYNVTVSGDENVEHIHSTYHIAIDYLSKDWLLKAELSKKNPDWYYHNYIGGWLEKAEGVIYENHEIGEFPEWITYVHAIDWGNVDPLAMVKVAVDNTNLLLYVDEINYDPGMTLPDIERMFLRNCHYDDLIVCDHNEGTTRDTLYDAGWNIRNAIKKPLNDRIRRIQGYKIITTPRSHNLRTELNNYTWHDKRSETPIDKFNHLINAMEYGFEELTNNSIFV